MRFSVVFLSLTFSLILATAFVAFRLAIHLLDLFTNVFLPGVAQQRDTGLAAILAGFLFVEVIHALRWRRWREAFLRFAIVSGVASLRRAIFGSETVRCFLASSAHPFLRRSMPRESSNCQDIDRPQFFPGVIAVSALLAVEAALLGTGLIRQVVCGCVYIALFVWFAIRV